ncbi:hypothetical protein HNQ91_001448 [Filimonas zeae]|nr:DUF5683 domain-containing protein [Filimonas zeae]MDR6338397.1 hypothetical protein [Filimonas zeae]
MLPRIVFILLLCCSTGIALKAQDAKKTLMGKSLFDTTAVKPDSARVPAVITNRTTVAPDTSQALMKKKAHSPGKATARSAMIPGWGQAYNGEYWKIPIVWGALSIPALMFEFNNRYYQKTKFAYEQVFQYNITRDEALLRAISADVKRSDGQPYGLSEYQSSRNFYRQNRDYSVLWFVILWGVNVVDATVFGHLKHFDVSDDLSLQIKPTFNSTGTNSASVGLAVSFKKPEHKLKPLPQVK